MRWHLITLQLYAQPFSLSFYCTICSCSRLPATLSSSEYHLWVEFGSSSMWIRRSVAKPYLPKLLDNLALLLYEDFFLFINETVWWGVIGFSDYQKTLGIECSMTLFCLRRNFLIPSTNWISCLTHIFRLLPILLLKTSTMPIGQAPDIYGVQSDV